MLIIHIIIQETDIMKNTTLQIRFEKRDADRLKKEATKLGLTLSAWVRMRMLIDIKELDRQNITDGQHQKKGK